MLVSGKAEVGLKTQCVRCLNDAFIHVEGQVEGFVKLKSDAKLLGDAKEDECVCIQRDKTVDISTLIESAILLEVPTNPLCSKDCKGLFKYCNRGDRCMFPSNSPFEVLKNYEF